MLPDSRCRSISARCMCPRTFTAARCRWFWTERDPQSQKIIAIKNYISTYEQSRTIWMDGQPHPPAWAVHTWMGFSTGKWEGNILTVYTSHIKQGWVRRDGLPE